MSEFYFAWVDKTDSTFIDAFKRNDADVYGFSLTHAEGDFPALDIDLLNPKVGLLSTGRKQWAWLAWKDESDVTHPLFFGRLVGIPQALQDTVIRLSFIARPTDYEAQRGTLYASMAVAPYFDPIWLADPGNPDAVLEGYTKLWHIDRVTHVVTASDIITGEDGSIDFDPDDVPYDSVQVSYSQSPARTVVLDAAVNWTQTGKGTLDLTTRIIAAFADGNTEHGLTSARGNPVSGDGVIAVIPGQNMIDNWPKKGTNFGAGWAVASATATVVGDIPTPPVFVQGTTLGDSLNWNSVLGWLGTPDFNGIVMRSVFDRQPGFIAQTIPTWAINTYGGVAHGPVSIVWFPIWRVAPTLVVGWDAARPRQETVHFQMDADVQPLLTDPGEEEIVRISLGPVDVSTSISDQRSNRFFGTTRGKQAFENLIARARATLLARARAIDVSFDLPFPVAIGLSCRKSGAVFDDRLPGGSAAGKVKGYSLTADGDSGTLIGNVTLGCTIGRDGSVEEVVGDPDYVVDAYVAVDYQVHENEVIIPTAGDVGYRLGAYDIDDDGVNLFSVLLQDFLLSIVVTGTVDHQQSTVEAATGYGSAQQLMDLVSGFTTQVEVTMRPILNTSFQTNISPYVSELKVPRTIDLEAT